MVALGVNGITPESEGYRLHPQRTKGFETWEPF